MGTHTKLIANGTAVTAEGEFAGDVLIEGEKHAAVATEIGRVVATAMIFAVDQVVASGGEITSQGVG